MNQLTTQCDEAEVDIEVHEEIPRKNPSPQPESISRSSSHRLEVLPSELWVTHIVNRTLPSPCTAFPKLSLSIQFGDVAWTTRPEMHWLREIMRPRDLVKQDVHFR